MSAKVKEHARSDSAHRIASWPRVAVPVLAFSLISVDIASALAQSLTPDPGAWRPLAYSSLLKPTRREATFVDIWKDALQANNRAYVARGDGRFAGGNAPATEAHYIIWSPRRSVVVSMLNTALGCTAKARDGQDRVVVKLCPMRVAIYEGLTVRTMDAGRGCFIEPTSGAQIDPSASAVSGAYDVATKTLKIGVIVNHRVIDGCLFSIPLARE